MPNEPVIVVVCGGAGSENGPLGSRWGQLKTDVSDVMSTVSSGVAPGAVRRTTAGTWKSLTCALWMNPRVRTTAGLARTCRDSDRRAAALRCAFLSWACARAGEERAVVVAAAVVAKAPMAKQ